MTRAAPNQPAVRAALNGLFPAALPWIVDLAATGHQNAWNAIIEQYAPMILSICHRYGLAGAEVDNVGQTVWLRLVNGLGSLRDPAALPKWLATVTQQECLLILKMRRSKRLDTSLADSPQSVDDVVIDEEILAAERRTALRAAVAELPPRCQQLLSMLTSDPPHSYAEISAELGIPVGSIPRQRDRCLAQLRAIIARHDSETGANILGGEPGHHSWAEDGDRDADS